MCSRSNEHDLQMVSSGLMKPFSNFFRPLSDVELLYVVPIPLPNLVPIQIDSKVQKIFFILKYIYVLLSSF